MRWLAVDRTGRHAYVGVEPASGRSNTSLAVLYLWDGQAVPEPVRHGRRTRTVLIAW